MIRVELEDVYIPFFFLGFLVVGSFAVSFSFFLKVADENSSFSGFFFLSEKEGKRGGKKSVFYKMKDGL